MTWTTVALIALGVVALLVLLWFVLFFVVFKHIARFQKGVLDEVMGKPTGDPMRWESSRTVTRRVPKNRLHENQDEE